MATATSPSESPSPSPSSGASAPARRDDGLAAGSMSAFEVLSQSVAGIAPSAVMATGPALVALGAGGSVMYSYLFSTVILLMVGWCISQFARRSGNGASLLSYVNVALGPAAGFLGAIGLAFGYVMIGLGCLGGITLYIAPLLTLVGVPGASSTIATVLVMIVTMTLATAAMVKGVQLSTRIGVVLEVLSIVCILAVVVAVLGTHGFSVTPLRPPDLGASSIAGGMVLAILGYVGFESAACMGTEARDPGRTIPRAVLGSALIVGVLYLLSAYAQLVGFADPAALSSNSAPLNTLADGAGVHALGYLVDLGAVASFFACITGSLNAASRLLHSMGNRGLLPRPLGRAHEMHRTPHVAIVALATITGASGVIMSLGGMDSLSIFAIAGTIGTYGYMVAYLLVTVGVTVFLARRGEPVVAAAAIGGVATLGMLFVLFRNVYPVPAAPYNILPWLFLTLLVLAAAWYAVIRSRVDADIVEQDLIGVQQDLANESA